MERALDLTQYLGFQKRVLDLTQYLGFQVYDSIHEDVKVVYSFFNFLDNDDIVPRICTHMPFAFQRPESLIFKYPTHQKAEAAVALALLLLSRLLEAAAANLVRVQSLRKRPAAKMPLFFLGRTYYTYT